MNLKRSIIANRLNSQRSTGPKSLDGKARSSQNARRHGLTSTLDVDIAERDALAFRIAESEADPVAFAVAQEIANAQLELSRIRQAREIIFSTQPPVFDSEPIDIKKLSAKERALFDKITIIEKNDTLTKNQLRTLERLRGQLERLMHKNKNTTESKFFEKKMSQLLNIERYERRALSRRKAAIAKFLEVTRVK
jgi:hypothetical protein